MKNLYLVTMLLIASVYSFSQQTVEKKEFYDVYQTKVRKVYNVTGDGKYHGSYKTFFKSGKIANDNYYYLDNCISFKEYDEAGNLMFESKKNDDLKFNGEQKQYVLIDGKPALLKYAKVDNGNLIEYKSGSSALFINNAFKVFDVNDKIIFSIINGNINGKIFFESDPNSNDKVIYTYIPSDYYIEIINNKICEIKWKYFSMKILPDNKHFFYKSNTTEGFYKLKNDSSNYVGFNTANLSSSGVNNMEFFFDISYLNNLPDFNYFNQKIIGDEEIATTDSIWTKHYDDKTTTEHLYRNGHNLYNKSFYANGRIMYEELLSNDTVADYTAYDENGIVIRTSKEDKEIDENNKIQKDLIEKINIAKFNFYESIFETYADEGQGHLIGYNEFMKTAYVKIK